MGKHEARSYLQIWAEVLGDVWTVALTENCDLLLDVLDLILSLLQVDGLDGDNALRTIVDTFKHLPEEEMEDKMKTDVDEIIGNMRNSLILLSQ